MNENTTNKISAVFGNGKSINIINDPGYGPLDFDKDHIKNIQDTVSSIIEERIKDLKEKSKRPNKNYEAYQTDQINENFALQEGYTAIGSDFHGDFWSLYAFLVQCGYLIPDKEKFLFVHLAKTKDGEQITYEFGTPEKYNLEDEKKKGNYVLALPGFKVNDKFKGTIELLGDYIDRGKESLMCLTLLDYLTRLEKQQKRNTADHGKEQRLNVHYGNHEYRVHEGMYRKSPLITNLIDNMKQESRMTYSSLRKKGDKYESFSHTSLCKKHVYNIIGILKVFYQIANGNVDKYPESIQKVKEDFELMKNDKRYKTLFDKLETRLSKEFIEENNRLKEIVDNKLKELESNGESINVGSENKYRRACLAALEDELFHDQEEFHLNNLLKDALYDIVSKYANEGSRIIATEEYSKLKEQLIILFMTLFGDQLAVKLKTTKDEIKNKVEELVKSDRISGLAKQIKDNLRSMSADTLKFKLSNMEQSEIKSLIETIAGDQIEKINYMLKINSKNQLKGYDLLENILAEEDYFLLRNFIADVVPFNTYEKLRQVGENDPFYTSQKIQVSKDKTLTVNVHYFNSLSLGDPYWPLWERYSPSLGETFKSVTQFVGHDAVWNKEKKFGPYVKNGIGNNKAIGVDGPMHIICVDTFRSFGYQTKKSDSVLLVSTPDGKYIAEKFSVSREKKGKITKSSLEKGETFILLSQYGLEFVRGNTNNIKRFSSFKNRIGAFYETQKNINTDFNGADITYIDTDADTNISTKKEKNKNVSIYSDLPLDENELDFYNEADFDSKKSGQKVEDGDNKVFDLIKDAKSNSNGVNPLKFKRKREEDKREKKKEDATKTWASRVK